jgi:hypothetical protein
MVPLVGSHHNRVPEGQVWQHLEAPRLIEAEGPRVAGDPLSDARSYLQPARVPEVQVTTPDRVVALASTRMTPANSSVSAK